MFLIGVNHKLPQSLWGITEEPYLFKMLWRTRCTPISIVDLFKDFLESKNISFKEHQGIAASNDLFSTFSSDHFFTKQVLTIFILLLL